MSKTARISHQQLAAVVVLFTEAAMLLYLPAVLAEEVGRDAWLAVPLGTLIGAIPVAYLLSRLSVYHPNRSLGEIAEHCLGRWLGKLLTLILASYSLFLASLVLRNVVDFSVIAFLPGTPVWAIASTFTAAAVYGVYCGVEVVTRVAVLIMFTALLAVAVVPIGVSPDIEVIRLLPILGNGLAPLLQASWSMAGWFAEIWVFAAWVGLIDKPRKSFQGFLWGLLGSAWMLTTVVLSAVVTLSPELTMRLTFPIYYLVQEISVAEFLERVELILLTIWLASMFVKFSACLWSATTTTASAFGLKSDRRIILPLAGVAAALVYVWPSIVHIINFGTYMWTPLTLPLAYGVPGLLTIISWWKRRTAGRHPA